MGRARTLSMGPRRKWKADPGSVDVAALVRLTSAAAPDLDTFRAVLTRVGAREGLAETVVYRRAVDRFRDLTGETPLTPG